MATNFIVVVKGRGIVHCWLAQNAELDALANRLQQVAGNGFECFIYSFTASPAGKVSYQIDGVLNLKREFYVHDIEPIVDDIKSSIEAHLCEYSVAGSDAIVSQLQRELAILKEKIHVETQALDPNPGRPQAVGGDSESTPPAQT